MTIARFRVNYLEQFFNQLIIKLNEIGEIKYHNIFIDATKTEAKANKFKTKLQENIKKLLPDIYSDFKLNLGNIDYKIIVDKMKKILEKLLDIKTANNMEFVSGKDKRKSKLQKYVEALKNFIKRQSTYDKYNKIFDGRNNFSKIDKNTTFMHMNEDHMKNG